MVQVGRMIHMQYFQINTWLLIVVNELFSKQPVNLSINLLNTNNCQIISFFQEENPVNLFERALT